MKRFWLFAAVLAAASVAAIFIFQPRSSNKLPAESTAMQTQSAILDNAAEIYRKAVDELSNRQRASITVTSTVLTEIAGSVFTEETQETIHYENPGTNSMRASVLTNVQMGNYSFDAVYSYNDGHTYLTLNETAFSQTMSPEAFRDRHIPLMVFDPSNYGSILGIDTGEIISIIFLQPTFPELWAAEANVTLTGGNASAILDMDGNLIESTYALNYTRNGAAVHKTIHVQYQQPQQIPAFPKLTDCTAVEDIYALTALERSCGYLLQAISIRSEAQETIFCEAFGDDRMQTVSMQMSGSGNAFTAGIHTAISLYNSSRGGGITNTTQDLQFSNGMATLRENTEPALERPDITAETMEKHCQNMLINTILLPEYICAVSVSETDDTYTYHYQANAQMSEMMCENICTILYQTPELLDSMASEHTDLVMDAFLTVDQQTGLPLSSGIRYESTYTINDYPYALRYETQQTYKFPIA